MYICVIIIIGIVFVQIFLEPLLAQLANYTVVYVKSSHCTASQRTYSDPGDGEVNRISKGWPLWRQKILDYAKCEAANRPAINSLLKEYNTEDQEQLSSDGK